MNPEKPGSYRNATRRAKTENYKRHLRELNGCGYTAGVIERLSAAGTVYYVRYYRSDNSAYLKKLATRKQRHTCGLPCGNGYRKSFEYWWNLI
ncbi:MAG: hypothetical protein ACI4LM_07665 [Anaerovoracaceae bacterium]